MLSIICALTLISATATFFVWLSSSLFRSCCEEATPVKEKVLAVSKEHLEDILKSREETIQLIQNTDLRLQAFNILPEEERKTFPPCFATAHTLNTRAKLAYDRNDFTWAAERAQRAALEILKAQNLINAFNSPDGG